MALRLISRKSNFNIVVKNSFDFLVKKYIHKISVYF